MTASESSVDFYIVGIGASAGGLEALEKFFSNTPSDSNMAFVVIQHLSPDYKSLMADLLSKRTDMPVLVAEDGMIVHPNHVYLIPPKQSITIFHGKLFLTDRESGLLYLPIDIFFHSLAQDLDEKAIGVILSGTGSDGARGLRAIKENGGLVIVQDEKTAKFDGMPRSAIATNLVDYILPPENIAREIVNYIQHPCLASDPTSKRVIHQDDDSLGKVFSLLRTSSGVDFTFYKQNTLVRRIERRMGIKQIEKLSDYLHFLYQNPTEVNTLFREFLIGVTRFFRDPEAYEEIKKEVIPTIFANKRRGDSIRVWVAGCSTGEEAYSIAILLTEYMEMSGHHMDVKVFATDLDKNALEFAGKGVYPESIAEDVSKDFLQNYFIKSGDSYAVVRRVREMVIFAQQNITTDPPFSKVDLVSCRNVLIYFQPVLQKKVIAAFQFGLNPDGFLFLGTSETIGESEDFFQSRHSKWKIYQYKGGFRPSLEDNRVSRAPTIPKPGGRRYSAAREDWRAVDGIQRGLIEAFLNPVLVVDENMDVVYIAGDMDPYLRVSSGGLFTANVLKQARDGISIPLSTAIHKAFKDQQEVTYKNIRVGEEANGNLVDMHLKPLIDTVNRQKMVMIHFIPVVTNPSTPRATQSFDLNFGAQQRIQDLEHELQHTRESLQATVEELETSNEELQATNEELFAANEELQSTNEELHSVNEELITVNAEYHAKIQELTKLNEDVNNLLSSANIGTIFLDRDLRIRLFTSSAQSEIHLLAQDVGRPIGHVAHRIMNCDLTQESLKVLSTLSARELEAQSESGKWYQIKFLPYQTLQHQVGGVIITLMDITDFKRADEGRLAAQQFAQSTIDALSSHMCVVNEKGIILSVNQAWQKFAESNPPYASNYWLGANYIEICKNAALDGDADAKAIFDGIRSIQTGDLDMFTYEYPCHSPTERRWFIVKITCFDHRGSRHLVIAHENITQRKMAENALAESEQRYRLLISALPDTAILLFDHEHRYVIAGGEELEAAGFDKNKVEGSILQEAFPPNVAELFKPLYDKALAGETTSFEHQFAGKTYHQTITPLRNHTGQIYAGMVVSHNITDRVNMEKSLRENLEKYQALFDFFPMGVTVADRDGKILESNLEAERLLGLSRAEQNAREIDGQEWKIIRTDGSTMLPGEYASVRALKENKIIENVKMGIVKSKKDITWLNVTAAPLSNFGVVVTYSKIEKPK